MHTVTNVYDERIRDDTVHRLMRRLHPRFAREVASAIREEHARTGLQQTLAWGRYYLPHYFAKPPSALHEWLGAQLDSFQHERGKKVNLVGPRGSAKSTIATLCYVLRSALEGWEPYIWIVSDTIPQAQMHLENVRSELLGNAPLAVAYPQAVGRGPRWRVTLLELPNGVVIEAIGTGQRIRGRRKDAVRPTLIICDDLQNDSHISSAAQRDDSRRWFHGNLLNAGDARTNIVNLATALHREALAMELLTAPGWVSKRFSAIQSWPTNLELWRTWESIYSNPVNSSASRDARKFYDEHQAEMNKGSVVLWPDHEDLYMLMQMRAEGGRAAFEREKQASPFDPELCEWPEEYFDDHIWFERWPEGLMTKAIALDPSKGADSRRGDYSAFVLVGIDAVGLIYAEADMARRPTPEIVAEGAMLCQVFEPAAFGVEANQFQELLCGELAREFERQGVAHLVPSAIHNHVNKRVRIRRLGPYLSQHRLRFLRGSASTRLLVDQLRDFPAGAHDDGPDALEMALRLAEASLDGRRADDGLGDRLPVG